MRTARTSGVFAILLGSALKPLSILAASVPNFPPNPVGEKLYRTQLFHETLLPVVIIAGALLAAWVVHRIASGAHEPAAPTESAGDDVGL